ncbi:4-carboxymuconolactone decarboxylase [Lactiplantibacillus plantarum]|nr:4-carboxymuconolactone decarboxylase [Lactiplantibacillus plantarum]
MTVKQTAGRDNLGKLAPQFAALMMMCYLVKSGHAKAH